MLYRDDEGMLVEQGDRAPAGARDALEACAQELSEWMPGWHPNAIRGLLERHGLRGPARKGLTMLERHDRGMHADYPRATCKWCRTTEESYESE